MIGRRDFETSSSKGELLSLSKRVSAGAIEHEGFFSGEHGVVGIWTVVFGSGSEWTVLYASARGRTYRRDWRRCWNRRTLPGLCREFLADVEAGDA